MVIVIRPSCDKIRYDLGGLLFGTLASPEDAFEFLHALTRPGNQFVIQAPIPDSPEEAYDLEGLVIAGRLQQYLYSEGMSCSVLYADSPFRMQNS